MSTPLSSDELFAKVFALAPANDAAAALELADREWPGVHTRAANAADAETCRLAMLSCLDPGIADHGRAATWRARALARFALIGWREGVASILMAGAFTALAQANRDYADGKTLDVVVGSDEALLVLDELEPFTVEPGSGITVGTRSPTPQLVRRFLYEKRGFLLLLAGRYADARASYAEAAGAAATSPRGSIKVRAGLALVDYRAALDGDGDPADALARTEAVATDARELGEADLVRDAEHNAAVMRAGGTDLVAYEIL